MGIANRLAGSTFAGVKSQISYYASKYGMRVLDVEVDPEEMGGEPTVCPVRLTAQTVIECEELGETPEEIVENYPGTPLDKVKAILSFYHAQPRTLSR